MRVLVTGAGGQLGTALREAVRPPGMEIVFAGEAELDITDREAFLKFVSRRSFDVLINCAAYTAVDRAESDAKSAYRLNVTAVRSLADFCSDTGTRLFHFSTDYVFDGTKGSPYHEEDPANPLSVYGRTKYLGEEEIRKSGCMWIMIRTSWLYYTSGNNFVRTIIRKAKAGETLRIVDDQVGTPTYAGDLAHAVLQLLGNANAFREPVLFHFSNKGTASWFDFALAILELAGIDAAILPVHTADMGYPAPRPACSLLDCGKIAGFPGVRIPEWKDSLSECIRKMSENGMI